MFLDWIQQAKGGVQCRIVVKKVMNISDPYIAENFSTS
jgi:hypothetical protein